MFPGTLHLSRGSAVHAIQAAGLLLIVDFSALALWLPKAIGW